MIKRLLSMCCVVAAGACGGGGGSDPETGLVFLGAAPSEQVLCSLVVGQTTQTDVLDLLGEPTHYSEDSLGAFFQYWVGSEAELGRTGLRAVLLSFDAQGRLDSPSVQQIPFPQCWREQLAARDAAREVSL